MGIVEIVVTRTPWVHRPATARRPWLLDRSNYFNAMLACDRRSDGLPYSSAVLCIAVLCDGAIKTSTTSQRSRAVWFKTEAYVQCRRDSRGDGGRWHGFAAAPADTTLSCRNCCRQRTHEKVSDISLSPGHTRASTARAPLTLFDQSSNQQRQFSAVLHWVADIQSNQVITARLVVLATIQGNTRQELLITTPNQVCCSFTCPNPVRCGPIIHRDHYLHVPWSPGFVFFCYMSITRRQKNKDGT